MSATEVVTMFYAWLKRTLVVVGVTFCWLGLLMATINSKRVACFTPFTTFIASTFASGHINCNNKMLLFYFNRIIFDFSLFSSSAILISSIVACVVLLNQPQNNTFFVETDCTTFQQWEGTVRLPTFVFPK